MKAWTVPVSVALHLAALAALLPRTGERPATSRDVPPIEVELIQQPDATPGAQPGQQASPDAATAQAPVPDPDGTPAASLPSPPRAASGVPAVNLGDSDQWMEGLTVTGRGIRPAEPDAAHRNLPPRYPADAARRRAEGTVNLVIHVSARGVPERVSVNSSSGDPSLDRAARDAVRLWRFTPALDGDNPVPFDYAIDIRFVLGDAR